MRAFQSQPIAPSVSRDAPVIRRACACGAKAGNSGQCPACDARRRYGVPGVQAKLRVSDPGDRHEREADAVADRVMGMGPAAIGGNGPRLAPAISPLMQRQTAEDEEDTVQRQAAEAEEVEEIQAKAAGPAARFPSAPGAAASAARAAAAAVSGGGRPLSTAERSFFEPRFGRDFSSVRLHDDASAGAAARNIHARAYTLGRNIAFAPGQYRPHTNEGRRLMAHELAHTVQQSSASAAGGTGPVQQLQRDTDSPSNEEDEAGAVTGPLTTNEQQYVFDVQERGQTQDHTLTDDSEANALIVAESIFCSRMLGQPYEGEDPLLCIISEITRADPRVAAIAQHVLALGPVVNRSTADPRHALEVRPSTCGAPCACLIFIHSNESNARWIAEQLHQGCRFNLAIMDARMGRRRRIRAPGVTRSMTTRRVERGRSRTFVDDIEVQCNASGGACTVDPNELFPESIQEHRPAQHTEFHQQQRHFLDSIRGCTDGFSLPAVALHNNVIGDTAAIRNRRFRRAGNLAALSVNVFRDEERENQSSQEWISREELRRRLGSHANIMGRRGTTNIFRWCNLPEISHCHIGDPASPDHVIWVTNPDDFDRLSLTDVNVVLQGGAGGAGGSESSTDLSTLFARRQQGGRYVNIETPIRPRTAAARGAFLDFVREVLQNLDLEDCCDCSSTEEE